jgi:deoxynucleotide monophosphate kinase-like protein
MTTITMTEPKIDVQEIPYAYTDRCNMILIGGKAGVGKTKAATYLYKSLNDLFRLQEFDAIKAYYTAFAYPIKEIAINNFNWDGAKDFKGRRLLQVLGAEAGRAYDEEIWIKKLEDRIYNQILPYNFVFVDDWRFPNERDYFKENPFYEVTTIGITRDVKLEEGLSSHPSENSLDMDTVNFVIDNNGTIEELYNKLDSVYRYLTSKIIIY